MSDQRSVGVDTLGKNVVTNIAITPAHLQTSVITPNGVLTTTITDTKTVLGDFLGTLEAMSNDERMKVLRCIVAFYGLASEDLFNA